MRTYELVFLVDPRVSDEDVVTMTQEYKQMISTGGSQVSKVESWGRRKLAYPINKLNEGKYVMLGIESAGGKTSLPEVEHRMRQNDKILRYLTVRTDLDLKRAASRHPASAAASASAGGESPAPGMPAVEGGAAPAGASGSPGSPGSQGSHGSPGSPGSPGSAGSDTAVGPAAAAPREA
jgi:small subunit ribosomal protein S6